MRKRKISDRETKKPVFEVTDLTRFLKTYGWTFNAKQKPWFYSWTKVFKFSHPLRIKFWRKTYFCNKLTIEAFYSVPSRVICLNLTAGISIDNRLESYEDYGYLSTRKRCFIVYEPSGSKTILKAFLMLQNFAKNLPKTINSIETALFGNKLNQQQTRIFHVSELTSKISQTLEQAGETASIELNKLEQTQN